MALAQTAKNGLDQGLCSRDLGASIATVVDNDTGTVPTADRHRLEQALGSYDDTVNFLAKVNSGAGGAMGGFAELRVMQLMGRNAGAEFIAAVAANE